MATHDELFDLVKSMTKSEKKHFQQFSSVHGREKKKDYLILFNAISKQSEYNELKLKIVLAKNDCKNELRHVKHYLYNQLLRSLNVYHHNSSKYEELKYLMASVRMLHRKGLHEQCRKLLNKAKKIALNHDYFGDAVDIMNWNIRLMYNAHSFDDWEQIFSEAKEIRDAIINTQEYQERVAELHVFHLEDAKIKTSERRKKLEQLVQKTSTDINDAKTYTAKENFYRVFLTYYGLIGDAQQNRNMREAALKLMESNPFLFKEEKMNYVMALGNFLIALLETEEFELALELTGKIESSLKEIKNNAIAAGLLNKCNDYKLFIYIKLHNKVKLKETLIHVEEMPISDQVDFDAHGEALFTRAAYAYFVLEEFSDSIRWSNKIISKGSQNYGQGNMSAAILINLMAHYELGNMEQLIYYVKNTHRNLKKINQLNKLESLIITQLGKFAAVKNEKDLIKSYEELKEQITETREDPYESLRFETFLYIAWLDHRIHKISILEAIEQQG